MKNSRADLILEWSFYNLLITGSSERQILPVSPCQPITAMGFRLSRDHPMTAMCNRTETELVNLKNGILLRIPSNFDYWFPPAIMPWNQIFFIYYQNIQEKGNTIGPCLNIHDCQLFISQPPIQRHLTPTLSPSSKVNPLIVHLFL